MSLLKRVNRMADNKIPVISTGRCLIRPFQQSDIFTFMEYRNNEQWMCYQGFKGLTYEQYCQILLMPTVLEEGVQLAIINQKETRLIGDLYLKKEADQLWLGYTIHPLYQRQGYIYEAVQGIIKWALQEDISFLKASILPENIASRNLLIKLGFNLITREEEEDIFSLPL